MVLHDCSDSAYHPPAPLMGFPEVCRGRPGRSTNAMAELYPEPATSSGDNMHITAPSGIHLCPAFLALFTHSTGDFAVISSQKQCTRCRRREAVGFHSDSALPSLSTPILDRASIHRRTASSLTLQQGPSAGLSKAERRARI